MRGPSRPSRQLLRLGQSRSARRQPLVLSPASQWSRSRYISSASNGALPGPPGLDIAAIRADMLARPPQIHSDVMYPMNSDHLTRALSDFLPEECCVVQKQRTPTKNGYEDGTHTRTNGDGRLLPAGHHLVYFPLKLRPSELCPDGTDPYHSPQHAPFTRRMWAAGSVRGFGGMVLDGVPAVCLERIADVSVRGAAGAEKIFVEVLREYTTRADFERRYDPESMRLGSRNDPASPALTPPGSPTGRGLEGITESRTLVFMREQSDEEKKATLEKKGRIVQAPNNPDYSVQLTPTPTLLFQYSALTYNAHRIHLDRAYCREVEGHRDLLVHGPLSLTLMLSALQSRLAPGEGEGELVDGIDYRHLAPLYVGQPMRVCVALQKMPRAATIWAEENGSDEAARGDAGGELKGSRKKWDLWVENQDGGLCVRGTAETIQRRMASG